MSRNIGQTECARCGHVRVELEEPVRPINSQEAGRYYAQFSTLQVANATCPRCQARYLAWADPLFGFIPRELGYNDLSWRSTFNDEPGEDDTPVPNIVQAMRDRVADLDSIGPGLKLGEPWASAQALIEEMLGMRDE